MQAGKAARGKVEFPPLTMARQGILKTPATRRRAITCRNRNYDGYCSYAMATKDKKGRADQEEFIVNHNGKLDLLYSRYGRDEFPQDPGALTAEANKGRQKFRH